MGDLGRRTTTGVALAALVTAGLAVAPAQAAADLVVTNTEDTGEGSLRQALADAAASPADDRITFAPPATGTILLTNGQLEAVVGGASGDLVIEGPGADVLTIDAHLASRVLDVRGFAGEVAPHVEVSGVTLTRGYVGDGDAWQSQGPFADDDGGGLRALQADVRLEGVVVSASRADVNGGGVFVPDGDLAVVGSTISGNRVGSSTTVFEGVVTEGSGGGLAARSVDLTDSRVTGNHAEDSGGGVAARTVTAGGSTIDGNYARRTGGALFASGDGEGQEISLISSTVADNMAEVGGGIAVPGTQEVELVSSTLAGNSAAHAGGILLGGEVSLVGSVVAGNAGDDLRGQGPATLTGSLVQEPGDAEVQRDGASVLAEDPLLSALADHGGPTPTMLPASDSVVVDRVASSAATDQRGFPRTVGEHADMGSVELTNAERVGLPGIGSTSAPTVEGRVRVGERLRTDGGSWDVEGVQLAYQWLRDGVPVPDATERSYVVSPDDFFPLAYGAYDQRRLSVRVTASAPGHLDGSRLSDLTDRPVRGRMRVERPARVTGKTRVGSILRARPRLGGVVPRPDAVTVSWYVDGTFQRRAYDDRTFRLRPRMRGQRVTVAFRYTSHGYRALRQTDRTSRPVH